MRLAASGMITKRIARRLEIQPDTLREHLDRIISRYEATGQTLDNPIKIHYAALDAGYLQDGREVID